MTLILEFSSYKLPVANVQSIRLVGPGIVETQTFGNEPVTHKHVIGYEVEPFNFERATSCEQQQ